MQLLILPAAHEAQAATSVGLGSYETPVPPGLGVPTNNAGAAVTPLVSGPAASKPVSTNEWWSSLLWRRDTSVPYSQPLFAYPVAARAYGDGLHMGYATQFALDTEFHTHFDPAEALTLGVVGLQNATLTADDWTDWTVTAKWAAGSTTLRTIIGHGLPFVYATKTGGDALISFKSVPTVWAGQGTNALGVTVNGAHYGIFAPSGATWQVSGTTARSNLAGKDYFSVAVLPNNQSATLNDYKQYAYAFVTDTQVQWSYNESAARLTSTYAASVTPKEGSQTGTLMALLPHQWRNSSSALTGYTYQSARGTLKVVRGASFSTQLTSNGVLPTLPVVGNGASGFSTTQLRAYVDSVLNEPNHFSAADTYFSGKQLLRVGMVAWIADQIGDTTARDQLIGAMKAKMQDWLSVGDGTRYVYNPTWDTLVGYPSSFGSDTELNDHHFHNGYFVLAAAIIGNFDPSWVNDSAWGGMVKMLIRDANSWSRNDALFPFLRAMDVYEGHTWASGHAGFGNGNDAESSSEAMLFNTGVLLFGAVTGDQSLRDFGMYLYLTEASALEEYWFDVHDDIFPAAYNHKGIGMVWGNGAAHATWFSGQPEMIHGINVLPVTGGSLYLGRYPSHIDAVYQEIVSENGGPVNEWVDIMAGYQALSNPSAALGTIGQNYTPEDGESKAHTYAWIHALNQLGHLATSVTASSATAAVFSKSGAKTYVIYNPRATQSSVAFSDGTNCTVSGHALVALSASQCQSGPPPTATPTPTNPGSRDAYSTIEAESFDSAQGVQVEATQDAGGGQNVGWIASGDYLVYNNVDFGSGQAASVQLRFASAASVSGQAQLRLDSLSGPLIGSVALSPTGGWQQWETRTASVSGATGKHTLYVVFSSAQAGDLGNVNWLVFQRATPTATPTTPPPPTATPTPTGPSRSAYSTIEAESFDSAQGVQVEGTQDAGGGQDVGWIADGDYLAYSGVSFGSTVPRTVEVRVASGAAAGISGLVEFRLDSRSGPLLASVAVASTGGWQQWQTLPMNVSGGPTGIHTIYVVFSSGQPADFVNVNWFRFKP